MKNALETSKEYSNDIADSVSKAAHEGLEKVSEGSRTAMDKGAQAAQYLQQTRGVTYVKDNPLKTVAIVAAVGVIAYSLFARKKKAKQQAEVQE